MLRAREARRRKITWAAVNARTEWIIALTARNNIVRRIMNPRPGQLDFWKAARSLALCAWMLGGTGCRQETTAKPSAPSANAAEHTAVVEQPPPTLTDFTKSNAVGCVLGGQEYETGLQLAERERDGLSTIVKVDDVPCRLMSPRNGSGDPAGYLYFKIDPAFKQAGVQRVSIEVEYFDVLLDAKPVSFGIQYDASGAAKPRTYAWANPKVGLRGSNAWQTATFRITDGTFQNAQNGRSDFRIRAEPPELYVRRVTVTRTSEGR